MLNVVVTIVNGYISLFSLFTVPIVAMSGWRTESRKVANRCRQMVMEFKYAENLQKRE